MSDTKILIVEDSLIIAHSIQHQLEHLGYTVCGAVTSGSEAIAAVQQDAPDLILMDIKLDGDMDGIETATCIRAQSTAPVVYLAAYTDERTLKRAAQAEPFGYIVKPFSIQTLHSAIETALYKHRAEQQINHLNRILLAIRDVNQIITRVKNRDQLLSAVCQCLIEMRDCQSAWIVYLDESGQVDSAAQAGLDACFDTFVSRLERGNRPPCWQEIIERQEVKIASANDAQCAGCILACAHEQRMSARLEYDGQLYGVLTISMRAEIETGEQEVALFKKLAGDIALALRGIQQEEKRIQAEKALRTSESTLRSIFRAAPVGVGLVSNRMLLHVNDLICEMTGYSRQELEGQNARILYPTDEDYDYVGKVKYEQIQKRGTGTVETRWRCKDGTIINVLLSSTPLDMDDWAEGVTFTALDITNRVRSEAERQKTQDALRESEERFRLLSESSPTGVFIVQDEHFCYVNPAMSAILGYSPDELTGEMSSLDIIHPDDRPRIAESMQQRLEGEVEAAHYTARGVRQDGEIIDIEVLSRRIEYAGRFALMGNILDITEHRRTELERERLLAQIRDHANQVQQIVDTVPEGVLPLDESGRVKLANPAAQRDLALLAGAGMSDAIAELLPWPRGVSWQELLVDQQTLEVIGRPTQIAPEMTGWVVVIRNMTHERELQARMRQHDRLAAIGQLAGGVAHDFNNILMAIRGYAEFAFEELRPDDPVRADLDQVRKAADRAAALTNQLLVFSRKQVLQPQVINLNQVITDMEDMLHRLIGEDIELHTHLNPSLGQTLADLGQIEQVIMNLSVNARDAMPYGGKLIIHTQNTILDESFIRTCPDLKPGPYVMLTVTDTGVGMSDEVQEHLFEPFFTTKEQGKGTGLGLSMVHGIVMQSQGHVEVKSKIDQGTTLKIYLPQVAQQIEPVERKDGLDAQLRGTETILLVEDEASVRALVRRGLERYGYTLLEAHLPSEAERLCRRHSGDIALLIADVVMPEISGKELANRIAMLHPGIPTLYISGYTDNQITQHGVLEPGVSLLEKPFKISDLARKVRELLDEKPPD
ncbi:MAG: PAS domain S-box protein [Anaerolineae bacterium]|nr:PAS domain S-box protein [Anaerolineae bacterium]